MLQLSHITTFFPTNPLKVLVPGVDSRRREAATMSSCRSNCHRVNSMKGNMLRVLVFFKWMLFIQGGLDKKSEGKVSVNNFKKNRDWLSIILCGRHSAVLWNAFSPCFLHQAILSSQQATRDYSLKAAGPWPACCFASLEEGRVQKTLATKEVLKENFPDIGLYVLSLPSSNQEEFYLSIKLLFKVQFRLSRNFLIQHTIILGDSFVYSP